MTPNKDRFPATDEFVDAGTNVDIVPEHESLIDTFKDVLDNFSKKRGTEFYVEGGKGLMETINAFPKSHKENEEIIFEEQDKFAEKLNNHFSEVNQIQIGEEGE